MKTPHNTSISFWRIRRVRARRIRRVRARRRWAYCRALVAAGLHPIAAYVEASGGRGLFWYAMNAMENRRKKHEKQ